MADKYPSHGSDNATLHIEVVYPAEHRARAKVSERERMKDMKHVVNMQRNHTVYDVRLRPTYHNLQIRSTSNYSLMVT